MRVSRSLGIGGGVLAILLEELVLEGAFEVVVLHFVEAVHVELPDKAVHFLVPEVAGEDNLFELDDVLDDELESIGRPINNLLVLFHLSKVGNTPSSSNVL